MKLIVLLFTATCLHAACTEISTKVWYCASTGNPTTDATTFYNFMDSQPFACGDTIILPANTRWHGNAYGLKPQTGCNGKYTKIYSDRVSEIPFGAKRNLINYRDKMVWFTTDSAAIFSLCNASWGTAGHRCANNYDIQGIRFSNYTVHSAVSELVWTLAVFVDNDAEQIDLGFPRNIAFRRNILEDRERELYGEANTNTNTDGNAFGSTLTIGLGWIGYGLEYTDCYCNLTGFYVNGWHNITSATNASPAVLSATGITAAIGGSIGSAMPLLIRGGETTWEGINTIKYGTPTSANDIEIRYPDPTQNETVGANFNSSGLGALSGTVSISSRQPNNQYCFYGNYGGDAHVLDNYFEGWNITVLTGGSSPVYADPAVVQAGSTASSVIVDHVRNLNVGDPFAIDMPSGSPISTYCTLPPYPGIQGCNTSVQADANLYRQGRVTAITYTPPYYTLDVTPHHIDGLDIAPLVGGNIWWRTHGSSRLRFSGNDIGHNGYLNNNTQPGKGPIEFKEGTNLLVDGNVLGGYLDSNGIIRANSMKNSYVHSSNQTGKNPDHGSQFVTFSNNTWSGQNANGDAHCAAYATAPQLGSGYYHSARKGANVYFDHNLFVGCDEGSSSGPFYGLLGNVNGRWTHNTFYWTMPPSNTTYFASHADCRPYFGYSWEPPDWAYYYSSSGVSIKDNIAPYGNGVTGSGVVSLSGCWADYQDGIKDNAIVDVSSQLANQAALDAVLPGNTRHANWTGFWTAACAYDSWQNCVIDPGHAAKGSASDGSDPGADVVQINDRYHRWSERAGLLKADLTIPAMVLNPGAVSIGSTKTVFTFRLFASTPANCTFKIFTTMNRSTLHGDTDSGGEQACNRAGSVSSDGLVSFVAGTSVALTAGTEYAYEITDGTRKMVGRFRTLAAGSTSQAVRVSYGSSRTGSYCTDTAMSTGCTSISSSATHSVVVPQGTVRYYQAAGGAVRPMVAR